MKRPRQPDISHPELSGTDNNLFEKHAPQYMDMCPVCGPRLKAQQLKRRAIPAIHRALVEFGYSSLTVAEVETAYDRAMAGEEPITIIDRMTASQLRDAGLLPENK